MVYCVQAYLIFANAATRDQRFAQAETAIGSRNRWSVTTLVKSDDPDPFALYAEARFISRSDQQEVNTTLKAAIGAQPGSWVQVHDCDHDESGNACRATVQRVSV